MPKYLQRAFSCFWCFTASTEQNSIALHWKGLDEEEWDIKCEASSHIVSICKIDLGKSWKPLHFCLFISSFFDERKPQVISKLMSENPQITWLAHSSFPSVSFPLWKCDKRSHAAFSGFADFFELLLFMRNLLSTYPSPENIFEQRLFLSCLCLCLCFCLCLCLCHHQ